MKSYVIAGQNEILDRQRDAVACARRVIGVFLHKRFFFRKITRVFDSGWELLRACPEMIGRVTMSRQAFSKMDDQMLEPQLKEIQ